ncbi:MAG: PEP-CTERM sorting domain-containing protein [Pirellulales bacterium]|nr:PEP-CTERM sorting domain-containing protein [Pirellulales bacterium]
MCGILMCVGRRSLAAAALLGAAWFHSSATAADELLVSDRATDRILAFDPVSGAFVRVVSASPLLDSPSGLTMGPGGFVYVANSQTDVLKIDPVTGAATVFATGIDGPGGIAYNSQDDTLYVSELGQFNGNEVFQYNASGTLVNTIGTLSAPTGRSGMIVQNNELYVSSFGLVVAGEVLKHNGAGGLNQFASGINPGGPTLMGPSGLEFDAEGDLYVAGLIGQSVLKYPVTAGAVSGPASQFGGNVPYPAGLLMQGGPGDETLLITSLGNDNENDPIYGNFTFPGAIYRFDQTTGAAINFLVGDFDRDLVVDGDDLSVWEASSGVNGNADADGDGDSDGNDFLLWQRGVGNQGVLGAFQPTGIVLYSPGVAGAGSVPEPATLLLVATASGAALLRRRR